MGRYKHNIIGSVIAIVATVMASMAGVAGTASAAPQSSIVGSVNEGPQKVTIVVHSASMNRNIPVTVLTPKNRSVPSPTLYLLNGAGGGEDSATWDARTDYQKYFANKNVYVVTPVGGAFSYYTDWQHDDPVLGRNKWQTFLTKELPPLIDQQFHPTKAKALAGISMAGTSVLNIAIAAPHFYRSVAAFSGCARSSDPLGQNYIKMVVSTRGGGTVENMWGPLGGPGWRANDPYLNAAKLRGTNVYMTAGNGLPGPHERMDDPGIGGNPGALVNQAAVGGLIEGAIGECTREMSARLAALHIPAHVKLRPTGTHSWGYWQDDLHTTWPMIARDLR